MGKTTKLKLKRVTPVKRACTQRPCLHSPKCPVRAPLAPANLSLWESAEIPMINITDSESDTNNISENKSATEDTNMSAGTVDHINSPGTSNMETNTPTNPVEKLFASENLEQNANKRKISSSECELKNKKTCKTNKHARFDSTGKNTLTPSRQSTSTSNRYAPLTSLPDTDLDDHDIIEQDKTTHSTNSNKNKNKVKIPSPIIIAAKTNKHTELVNHIKSVVVGEFTIKYTANNTNIYIKNQDDKAKYLENLKKTNLQYHSYSDVKTHAFVLSGLTMTDTENEIKAELLKTYKINVLKVYKTSRKRS